MSNTTLEAVPIASLKSPTPEESKRRRIKYEKGFVHGAAYVSRLVHHLKQYGYARPQEIVNILCDHVDKLVAWRMENIRNGTGSPTPTLSVEPWPKVRQRVFDRDNRMCVFCFSNQNLECDHIVPVNEGGLPTMDNLRTLCADCHQDIS